VVPRLGVLPPVFPRLRLAALRSPLDRRGQVTDHRVEPDVDLLVWVVLPARERSRHAPVEVARDRPLFEVAHELQRVLADVGPPVLVVLDPRGELGAERGQVEEEMLCLTKLDRRITAALVRIDEVGRVELVAAVVALVAARIRESANRTLAFDVSIGKRASGLRIERPHLRLLHQVALLIELQEESLRDAVVVARGGAREDVVGHAETAEVLDDDRAVLIYERLRRDALP